MRAPSSRLPAASGEAEDHTPVAGDLDAPLARAVTLQGMQPEARCGGAARMRRLLQTEQDTPKPWRAALHAAGVRHAVTSVGNAAGQ